MRTQAAVYRHFDAAQRLLYIGSSANPFSRMANHEHLTEWATDIVTVTIEWLPSRQEALLAEWVAIQEERPIYNIVHNVQRGVWMKTSIVNNATSRQETAPARVSVVKWMKAHNVDMEWVSDKCETTYGHLCSCLSGYKMVSPHLASAIERVTGIPASDWAQP